MRESEINVAEGKKRAKILESEAVKAEQINKASGEAQAIIAKANARADALRVVAEAIGKKARSQCGKYFLSEHVCHAVILHN